MKSKSNEKTRKKKDESLKRDCRKSVLFNRHEIAAIDEYCKRFGLSSRSALIRKSVMECVFKGLDESSPTLF